MTTTERSVIYFDAAATTRCADDVVAAMVDFSICHYGNPSSPHIMGRAASRAVDDAIDHIADMCGCSAAELTLTSGATESNNIVVLGCTDQRSGQNIVICPIDHKSTIEAAGEMARRGVEVRRMKVDGSGLIDLEHLNRIIDAGTALVSLAYVNSEIGTLQNLDAIEAILANSPAALLHVDATQAAGKVKLDFSKRRIDCASVSAHKIAGPKGIGALYVSTTASPRLRPLTFGGGQYGLRSGTVAAPLVVGFGIAARRVNDADLRQIWNDAALRRTLIIEALVRHEVRYVSNSPPSGGVPSIINLSFIGVRSETVISGLPDLCVASGSACNSKSLTPSYVLKAIGCDDARANSAIRLSFTPDMDLDEVMEGAEKLARKISALQQLTAWETMHA